MWQYCDERSRSQVVCDQATWNHSNTEACKHSRNNGHGAIGFESTTGAKHESRIAFPERPRLSPLQNGFVLHQLVRRLRTAVFLKVSGARDKRGVERPYTRANKRRRRLVSEPNCAVEALLNQIHKAVAVRSLQVQCRVSLCELGNDRCEMSRSEGQWRGDSEPTAQLSVGCHDIPRSVEFYHDPHCILTECRTRFSERYTSRGAG